MKRDSASEVTIARFAQSGEGVATVHGRDVLVRGTLPGERVRLGATRGRHAALVTVVGASSDREVAACAQADHCGGCTWQHVPVRLQVDARVAQLRKALPPELRDLEIDCVTSDERYGWRSRARLAWDARGDVPKLGYRAAASHNVVDAPDCPVLVDELRKALLPLRIAVGTLGGTGEVSLACGANGKPVASLHAEADFGPAGFAVPSELVALGFAGVELWPRGVSSSTIAGDPRPVVVTSGEESLTLPPAGFAQAHEGLNRRLVDHVVAAADAGSKRVLELFAGAGNFTLALARAATSVRAVEVDRDAARALEENARARGLRNVTVHCGDAADAARGAREDIVVLDPPRSGARAVCERLVQARPKRIVYVSCYPATLAGDLVVLSRVAVPTQISVFEMFPHTPHVEVVVTLARS